MKKRHFYTLLFAVPGLLWSLLLAFVVFGMVAGALWLYVYGDELWPDTATKVLSVSFVLVFAVLWLTSLAAGYRFGKRREAQAGYNRRHVLVAVAATVLPLVLAMLHQFRMGNLGSRPDSALCADYCRSRGWSGSGMPPADTGERTCFCLDDRGVEAERLPLERIP